MKILGIDPGTTRIGFGLINNQGNCFEVIDYGILKNLSSDKMSNYKRVFGEISKLIKKHNPDIAVVEKLFFFKNQKTFMSVAEMRGVIMLTFAEHNIPTVEFTPIQIKQAISGHGRADKAQVQRMVKLILGIKEEIKPDDAADALAIAICGANNNMIS